MAPKRLRARSVVREALRTPGATRDAVGPQRDGTTEAVLGRWVLGTHSLSPPGRFELGTSTLGGDDGIGPDNRNTDPDIRIGYWFVGREGALS